MIIVACELCDKDKEGFKSNSSEFTSKAALLSSSKELNLNACVFRVWSKSCTEYCFFLLKLTDPKTVGSVFCSSCIGCGVSDIGFEFC